ncbi:MAG TPA: sigma-70 family RNA polymerase sigma factor [Vicinamibacterales bacterium]|nr:sigma-70 family RNA polymerase sigma factor [Vicinamibacterales bacterium]
MPGDITQLLQAHRGSGPEALSDLVPLVYEDLKRLARSQMRRTTRGASLDTGALVHEAYVKLIDQRRATWNDRRHFFAVAALAMRQIVVDRARHHGRRKRGGGELPVTLLEAPEARPHDLDQILAIDQALKRLEEIDPRMVRVVECRYFAGLNEQETADALDSSVRTVQREWFKARAWLRAHLEPGTRPPEPGGEA